MATDQAGDVALSLAEVSALLSDAFRGRASRANFRTGTLTVCTMLPMRSVPHRVVCLLGVDDGVFPRKQPPDGDNILGDEEWVGDHDVRSEDRQLLLDAVMSAQERLVVIFAGCDPRSGVEIPPAVPIGELLDALDTTARTQDGEPVRQQDHHAAPVAAVRRDQLHSRRARLPCRIQFRSLPVCGPYAPLPASGGPAVHVFGREPLPERDDDGLVSLSDLVRFFNHPIRALIYDRAGLWITKPDEAAGRADSGQPQWT